MLLAWLTQRLVARPAARAVPRKVPPRRALVSLGAAVVATAVVVVPVVGLQADLRQRTAEAATEFGVVDTLHPGAAALGRPDAPPPADLRPALGAAQADKGAYFTDGRCVQQGGSGPGYDEVLSCDLHAPEHPTATVLLAGGSHMYQWAEPFQAIAREHGWRLVLAGKGQCRVKHVPDPEHGCVLWGDNVIEMATELRPDAMIVEGTHTHYDGELEDIPAEQVAAWRLLDEAGIRLIGLRDNPRGDSDPLVRDCLAEHGATTSRCDLSRSDVYPAVPPARSTPGVPGSMVHIDLTRWYCRESDGRCPAVIGNVLVYRDASHLTNTFLMSMRPMLSDALRDQAPWLFGGDRAARP
jgi:hypothetical protein